MPDTYLLPYILGFFSLMIFFRSECFFKSKVKVNKTLGTCYVNKMTSSSFSELLEDIYFSKTCQKMDIRHQKKAHLFSLKKLIKFSFLINLTR